MSRYDGLIIPRSYSEYINKTDAATLTQSLRNTGLLPDSTSQQNKLIDKTSIILDATCESAADAEVKDIVLNDYNNSNLPNEIACIFTNGNTYGDTTAQEPTYPKCRIKKTNGDILATLDLCDSRGHYAGQNCVLSGDLLILKLTSTKLIITNSDVRQATSEYTIMSDGKIEQWIKKPISITNYNDNWQTISYPIPFSKIDSIQIQLYGSGYSQSYVPMIYNTNLDSCKFNVRVAQLESKPQTVYIHAIGRI